jgi:hypothetical protein
LLTGLPVIVFCISSFFTNNDRARPWLITIAYLSLLSKSVVHPILESYMTYETRQTILKSLSSCMKKLTENQKQRRTP